MTRRHSWAPWAAWTMTAALVVVCWALPQGRALDGSEETSSWVLAAVLLTVQALTFATVGLVILRAQPRHAIGHLFCGVGVFVGIYLASERYQYLALVVRDGHLPLGTLCAWLQGWTYVPALAVIVTVLPQLFPTGRVVSPRWRFGLFLAAAAFVGMCATDMLRPGVIDQSVVENPTGVPPAVYDVVATVGVSVYAVATLAGFASMVVRWRRAGRLERQQLKLFVLAAAMLPLFVTVSSLVNLSHAHGTVASAIAFAIATCAFLGLPVATALAILRHRLYDIDLVINRTIVYAVLTTLLVATYFVSVVVLGAALNPLTGTSDLAVAASTLAVAGLFRPLRGRVQAAVDRRFYRSRYDAARTLDSFADRLRHEVDLAALGRDLEVVVTRTMQPEHVSLWLRGTVTEDPHPLVTIPGRHLDTKVLP